MFSKILIANDGPEGAARALLAAIKLAKALGADLHMISVEELPRFASVSFQHPGACKPPSGLSRRRRLKSGKKLGSFCRTAIK
jgi:hypothetical protein